MAKNKIRALEFCAELGFLVLPCAFHGHSTTEWLYDVYDYNEELSWYKKEGFRLRNMDVHYFFDSPEADFFEAPAPLIQVLNTLIETAFSKTTELFSPVEPSDEMYYPNRKAMEDAGNVQYSPLKFIQNCTSIANVIDPMDWRSFKVTPNYLRDFMVYGFCIWAIERE
jgi:hypothetical protein